MHRRVEKNVLKKRPCETWLFSRFKQMAVDGPDTVPRSGLGVSASSDTRRSPLSGQMGPRRAPLPVALAAILVVCAAVFPAPVLAVDMLRRAGDAAAATGAADGVAVVRAQCEHRISALETSSSAALRDHEDKLASLTEERDDLAATVKRYKRGLLNLESKRKDEVAKLEQALRLATSGECPTPTLGDYIAPTLDSIRHAWHDALTAVANAYDAAAVGIWSRTRAALATGAGARRALISRTSAGARTFFPDDTDEAHVRETARTLVDVVIGAAVAFVAVAATSRLQRSSSFLASRRVNTGADNPRTKIDVVDEDEVDEAMDGGSVEWKTYRSAVPDVGTVRIEGPRRVTQRRGARLPDAISAAAEAFDDKPEDFDDDDELPGPPASPENDDDEEDKDGVYDEEEDNEVEEVEKLDPAAESKFVEVLNERAPPARVPARVVKTRSPAPPPVVPARTGVRAARPTPPPRTPPQGRATRAGAVSSRVPGLLSRASKDGTPTVAADVLDLNSTSDDLLSQHPWDDDGGWVDTMGTPDFQRKENKLGSPSKLPAAAGGLRRVSAPLRTTSPNVPPSHVLNTSIAAAARGPRSTPPGAGKLRLVRPGERKTTPTADDGSGGVGTVKYVYSPGENRSSSLGLTPDNKQITPRQRALAYAEARRKGVNVDLPNLGGDEGESVPRGGMRHRGALR